MSVKTPDLNLSIEQVELGASWELQNGEAPVSAFCSLKQALMCSHLCWHVGGESEVVAEVPPGIHPLAWADAGTLLVGTRNGLIRYQGPTGPPDTLWPHRVIDLLSATPTHALFTTDLDDHRPLVRLDLCNPLAPVQFADAMETVFCTNDDVWAVKSVGKREMEVEPLDFAAAPSKRFTRTHLAVSPGGTRLAIEQRYGPFSVPVFRIASSVGATTMPIEMPIVGGCPVWLDDSTLIVVRGGNELWHLQLNGSVVVRETLIVALRSRSPFASARWPQIRVSTSKNGRWIWARLFSLDANQKLEPTCVFADVGARRVFGDDPNVTELCFMPSGSAVAPEASGVN